MTWSDEAGLKIVQLLIRIRIRTGLELSQFLKTFYSFDGVGWSDFIPNSIFPKPFINLKQTIFLIKVGSELIIKIRTTGTQQTTGKKVSFESLHPTAPPD